VRGPLQQRLYGGIATRTSASEIFSTIAKGSRKNSSSHSHGMPMTAADAQGIQSLAHR
jgi:hypothetical protein